MYVSLIWNSAKLRCNRVHDCCRQMFVCIFYVILYPKCEILRYFNFLCSLYQFLKKKRTNQSHNYGCLLINLSLSFWIGYSGCKKKYNLAYIYSSSRLLFRCTSNRRRRKKLIPFLILTQSLHIYLTPSHRLSVSIFGGPGGLTETRLIGTVSLY